MITVVPPAEAIAVPPLILGMGQVDDILREAGATFGGLVDREFSRIELGFMDAATVVVLSEVLSRVDATVIVISVVFSHVVGAALVISVVSSRVGVMDVGISEDSQGSVVVPSSVVSC